MTHPDILDHQGGKRQAESILPSSQLKTLGSESPSSHDPSRAEDVLIDLFLQKLARVKEGRKKAEAILQALEDGNLDILGGENGELCSSLRSFIEVLEPDVTTEKRKADLIEKLRAKLAGVDSGLEVKVEPSPVMEDEKADHKKPREVKGDADKLLRTKVKSHWPEDFIIQRGEDGEILKTEEVAVIKIFISSALKALGLESRIVEFLKIMSGEAKEELTDEILIAAKQTMNKMLRYNATHPIFKKALRNASSQRSGLVQRILKALDL